MGIDVPRYWRGDRVSRATVLDGIASQLDDDVDVVFSNAGYGMAGPLEGVTDEQMLRMVHTNLMGPIRVESQRQPTRRSVRWRRVTRIPNSDGCAPPT